MTDSLRDRIAVALRGHGPMGAYYRDGLEFCSCGAETDGLLEFEAHLADAVIRELGLQAHLAKRIINGKPDQWVRRHVTDWEIVDE